MTIEKWLLTTAIFSLLLVAYTFYLRYILEDAYLYIDELEKRRK
jgi:hypothetical protein